MGAGAAVLYLCAHILNLTRYLYCVTEVGSTSRKWIFRGEGV